ncbi:hypothetical protein NQ318_004942 [Aromia moschata]|uniref:DNA-directed DNA polymerase n=1 Tax=Aromia moschata TaxID=1265417 RepID=A0AAV8X3S3_9CUCU|nr:hypothetical protein NQ318_004942 [Aromia moschata]
MSGYDFHMFIKKLFSDKKKCKCYSSELMRQKGVFPYSFVDNLNNLNSKYLPSKEQFYDNLNETHIKDVDYERAQKLDPTQYSQGEAYDSLATVNVVIAAYVTTQVHLKLYSYLELLGGRVLYYDTDSVIYIARDKSRVRCSNGRVPRRNYRRVRIIRAR